NATVSFSVSQAVAAAEAIERGAVGATSNPPIVLDVIAKEGSYWVARVRDLVMAHPGWSETELSWAIVEEMGVRGAGLLAGIHRETGGRKGWLSLQVDPSLYGMPERMVDQALHLASLAPNIQVKFPVTAAGVVALEEATAQGVNVNATVSFSVSQAVAAAEAIERGLARLEASGGDSRRLAPIVVIMIGRLDDWIKVVADRDLLSITPGVMDRAGIAAMKRANVIFSERGFRSRLLAAAFRHHLHWTELVGGNVRLTIPHAWQVRFNQSGIEPTRRLDLPVDPGILEELATIPDFRRAYEPDGMTSDEFDSFGATARTLRGFIKAFHDLEGVVRDIVLPNPDGRPA
ncbi:MAG: transaldolase family protein, partial [Isosphaeraceae bacterium]|nr:transaldolase family protein [Isosphaeraceae bacterium]